VIIPYTSQYTPLPFHPLHRNHDRKITYTAESNHDNYVGEESKNRIKVASLSDVSQNIQTWPTTSAIENAKKSIGTKVNNSIDVHRLQKNIDNWTIQVCRGFLRNIISYLNKTYTLYTFLEKICLFHNMEISFLKIKILVSNFVILYKYKRNDI